MLALAGFTAGVHAQPGEANAASDPIARLIAEKEPMVPADKDVAMPAPMPTPRASASVSTSASASASASLLRRARDRAADMVFAAMNFVGVRYRRGGESAETGFDCSGFTRHVYEMSLGLVLPRRADEQAAAPGLVAVPRDELKPGDLVFFNTMKRTFSHVGIYIGDDRFVHAPRTGQDIRTDSLSLAYWAKRFTGARRAEAVADAGSRQ